MSNLTTTQQGKMAIEFFPSPLHQPAKHGETDQVTEKLDARVVGRRLVIVRVAHGIFGPAEMADKLDIDRSNWTKYEKGDRMIPPSSAAKVTAAFSVSMDYLYLGDLSRLPHEEAERLRAADSMVPLAR